VPREVILIRHGESIGNVLREQAESDGAETIDLDRPDPDVELSEVGRSQAIAVGKWLATLPCDRVPRLVMSSPYRRARQTADIAVETAGFASDIRCDERLRDRELGVLDGLTNTGVNARLPSEAARRRHLGKFYYRPPGGESWADVAFRLRGFVHDLSRASGTLLIVTHDAVILNFCYIYQELLVDQLLDLASRTSVANGSVTRMLVEPGAASWSVAEFNSIEHLRLFEAPVTEHGAERDVHPH
jgi:broad specificity phosphatase PhoE